jgi:hypothetical protein
LLEVADFPARTFRAVVGRSLCLTAAQPTSTSGSSPSVRQNRTFGTL